MGEHDWYQWHRPYDDPSSPLSSRLAAVQRHVVDAVERCASGPIRAVSLCAGQGRDLIGAMAGHPRRLDVSARLVELDERNAEVARSSARDAGMPGVQVVTGDASLSDAYLGAVPADLVLACGIFGNITEVDIARIVGFLPQLCAPNAIVVWTRHRKAPDLTPKIRGWFLDRGFDQIAFDAPERTHFGIGVQRWVGPSEPLRLGNTLFAFVNPSDPT